MDNVDAIIIGAGFAGLRALYRLRAEGLKTVVLEASDEIGGVWNHNRYPGARCDVESYDYSYGFSSELEQEWRWSERYATQPEILRYINHVADRFDLRRDIVLNATVTHAAYDEAAARWTVETAGGQTRSARFLLLCMGQLSAAKTPTYPGVDSFAGEIIHSAVWPRDREISFAGKRVGIIGTGSSGMQMTPVIAQTAEHVTVFQRTANFSVPAANAPITEEEDSSVKAAYRERRERCRTSPTGLGFTPSRIKALEATPEEREAVYEKAYHRLGFGFALAYPDILLDQAANDTAADFIRRKIAERVDDPVLREKLTPRGHPFAARRPSVDSGYFEAFNRGNVELADIREHPIVEFTPEGVRTEEKLHELDMVIWATGFDAVTGSLLKPRIEGRGGQTLAEKWAEGPVTQLGLAVAGFPNMFIVVGPQSPSILSNVMVSIEEQVDWYADLLTHMAERGVAEIEATEAAEADWGRQVEERVKETLYMTTDSFYNGGEMAGKPRVFMVYSGGVRGYRRILQNCAAEGYAGFTLRSAPAGAAGTAQVERAGA